MFSRALIFQEFKYSALHNASNIRRFVTFVRCQIIYCFPRPILLLHVPFSYNPFNYFMETEKKKNFTPSRLISS